MVYWFTKPLQSTNLSRSQHTQMRYFRRRFVHGPRGMLNLAVFLLPAVIGVTLLGAAPLWHYRLPSPEDSDRDQLLRWLVTRDLGQESAAVRGALIERIEEEFRQEFDWNAVSGRMEVEHRRQLAENVPVLLRTWLAEKGREFSKVPAEARLAYLDDLLETIRLLGGVSKLCEGHETGSTGAASDSSQPLMVRLESQLNHWQKDADPQSRAETAELLLALRCRWLMQRWLDI